MMLGVVCMVKPAYAAVESSSYGSTSVDPRDGLETDLGVVIRVEKSERFGHLIIPPMPS